MKPLKIPIPSPTQQMIGFNRPFLTGQETNYIQQAVALGKISGDGFFTQRCHEFFQERYDFPKVLLTVSCTAALEMCALLIDIQQGDEVIMPAYTFVSTANAFVMQGAKIVFADSEPTTPNIDISKIETLITPKTKAIVVVHYGGVACDMEQLMALAKKHNLYIIEDAAHAIDSFHKGKPLGSIGHLATFSFHETKNVISGEGGMLVINDEKFQKRAEIIREKGTNRSAFFRGEVAKYNWVDIGSSYLPSDIIAAFLYAQLQHIQQIQEKRIKLWNRYYQQLQVLTSKYAVQIPFIPDYATRNGHLFYLVCNSLEERTALIAFLKRKKIQAVFHYLSLHQSPFFQERKEHDGRTLAQSDRYSDCLLRLPLYYELTEKQLDYICYQILEFYEEKNK